MDFFDKFVHTLTRWTAKIGQVVLAASMLIIVANIISRLFWKPVPGTVEIVEIFGAIMLSMGVAYCAILKGHIYVDILFDRFSPRVQSTIDLITNTMALVFSGLLARESLIFATRMMHRGYLTAHLKLPIHPSIYLVALGFIMLSLVLIRNILISLSNIAFKSEV